MRFFHLLFLLVVPVTPAPASDPAIVPEFSRLLSIEAVTPPGGDGGRVAQMAWGPDGRLYVATVDNGVHRFDYSPDGDLANPIQVSAVRALGLAFHEDPMLGAVMYLSEFRGSNTNAILRRLTDEDGDGLWGEAGEVDQEVVNNVPLGVVQYGHHMNQLQIAGRSLFVGIGVGSDVGNNENAYTGTLSWIEDLTLLGADTATPNLAGFAIADFDTDPTPYTSSDPSKLRVHSSGTRNPFGVAVDGDGEVWITVNQMDVPRPGTGEATVPQDQLFRAFERADYAFSDGVVFAQHNDVHDWRADPAVLAAGFFDPAKKAVSLTVDLPDPSYRAAAPHGLGPHSSADGFAFYDGNGLPVAWHKDAFVVRQSEQIAPPLGPYEDLVAVDLDTGAVVRVATGFTAPLDALADEDGNVLVGEVGFGNTTRIYRIRPSAPIFGPHPFAWTAFGDGAWSDSSSWRCDLDGDGDVDFEAGPDDRKVPSAWGTARYHVVIDLAATPRGSSLERVQRFVPGGTLPPHPMVTVDEDVVVESLDLAEALVVPQGRTLRATGGLEATSSAWILGGGTIDGDVDCRGTLAPGAPGEIGSLTIEGGCSQLGRIEVHVDAATADVLDVAGVAALAGRVDARPLNGVQLEPGTSYDVVLADSIIADALVLTPAAAGRFTMSVATVGGGRQALRLTVR